MNVSELDTNEESDFIVSLNISEINGTTNRTTERIYMKRPNDDSDINNIIFGIGLVVVILVLLLIAIKIIYRCYKACHEEDEEKEEVNKSPLIPSSSGSARRTSSIRNSGVPIHRSSLNLDTQIELRLKHLSQSNRNTPPTSKKT